MSRIRRTLGQYLLLAASACVVACDSSELDVIAPPISHHIDVGVCEPGAVMTREVDLTADGSTIRRVGSSKTTCGCVTVVLRGGQGSDDVAEITITAPTQPGVFSESITLLGADDLDSPVYTVSLRGTVEPAIMWMWGVPGEPLQLTEAELPWEQSLPLRVGKRVDDDVVAVRVVKAWPEDRLQLTEDRSLAGGTRVVLRVPDDAPRGLWRGEVVFELHGGGLPPREHSLPVNVSILSDQSPVPDRLFFGRMSAGQTKSIEVVWPHSEQTAPYTLEACSVRDAVWESTQGGGVLTVTMPGDLQGDTLRGTIEIADKGGSRWVLQVMALPIAVTGYEPLIDRVTRLIQVGEPDEAIAAALNRTKGDLWLPADDPFMLSESEVVDAMAAPGSPVESQLISRSAQITEYFRLMFTSNPRSPAHVEAIEAFIASLPPQGQRSVFVQSVVSAIERKLASLQPS